MFEADIKTSLLAGEINNAINAYNLNGKEADFNKSIDELKKTFPSCTDKEIVRILNIAYQINKLKKTEKSELVFTGPTSFLLKNRKIWNEVKKMISSAEKSILLTGYSVSEYFDEMLDLLSEKSLKAVHISLYLNDYEKHQKVLEKFLAYADCNPYIHIFKYVQPDDDKMAALHAKMLVVDGYKNLISSANLSYHGMEGNIEMGFYIESAEKGKEIDELLKNLKRLKVFEKVI